MNKQWLFGIALLPAISLLPIQGPQGDECAEAPPAPGIMSVAFAHEKSGETRLQRVFVGSREDFEKGHLAHSARLDLSWVRGEREGVKGMLVAPELWVGKLAEQGVESKDYILLYGNRVTDVTLAGWALSAAGDPRWYVLDGGLEAWKAAGYEVAAGGTPGLGRTGKFDLAKAQDAQALLGDVEKASRGEGGKLVDARPVEQYQSGFIPRAVNLPWPELLKKDGTFKPVTEIRKILSDAGLGKDDELIVYCNSAHQASADYFVLRHLIGFEKTRIYDGSLAEWKRDPKRLLVRP